ncbi:MAG: MSEP-CTERM sorting domain-containing protein [Flavobacterium sp.]|nr:MSEP-CTERM sorting domain-containing protein [Flavobacterium sp.]
MRNLVNPKWLLFINTLPLIVLFLIFSGEFDIIKSLLKPENIEIWRQFAIALSILIASTLVYAIIAVIRKKELSVYYGFAALFTSIPVLYLAFYNADELITRDIPRWMVPTDMMIYAVTFLMPTIIHAVIVLVIKLTALHKKNSPLLNFGLAAAVPFCWYIISQLFIPMFKDLDHGFNIHALLIFVISGTVIFLFFLIRMVYILINKKSKLWKRNALNWKIPLLIVFPLLGLMVNNGSFLKDFIGEGGGIFGDFSSIWIYFIALGNGILLCIPEAKSPRIKLILFFLKSATFTFTLYFFLVFLPFLPLSIIAILAIGVGFLMLTPLLLFVVHVKSLSDDFNFLSTIHSKSRLIIFQLAGMLMLPVIITCTYCYHKAVLNEALDYVYNPDFTKNYDIDATSVTKTLAVIEKQKERNNFIFSNQMPYLSAYFNWIVLDNMTLSDKKIDDLNSIFVSEHQKEFRSTTIDANIETSENSDLDITNAKVTSRFDEVQHAWISMVDFEIKNNSTNNWLQEFETSFELPAGCYISDYYLYVGNKKEHGLLMEKKAAQWVFSQIVNTRKDPGMLRYTNYGKIDFRIFPFTKNETRKSGIEFIHKTPLTINIHGKKIQLGDDKPKFEIEISNNDNVVYLSTVEKSKLEKIQRTPYYCFIADVSSGKEKLKSQYIQQIENFIKSNPDGAQQAEICFTNTYSKIEKAADNITQQFDQQTFEGGFYLDRSLKKILIQNYTKKEKKYPIMVVLTDSLNDAIIGNDLTKLQFTFPESDIFYTLNNSGQLEGHSMLENPMAVITNGIPTMQSVFVYPNAENPIAFLPDNGKADLVLKSPFFDIKNNIKTKQWQSGLQLQGLWMSQQLHPKKAAENWTCGIRESFRSGIMTPQTSYIVVENDAQKAMLYKKQKEVLSGNNALDLGEDEAAQRMSEPGLLVLATLFLLAIAIKKYKSAHLILKQP